MHINLNGLLRWLIKGIMQGKNGLKLFKMREVSLERSTLFIDRTRLIPIFSNFFFFKLLYVQTFHQ